MKITPRFSWIARPAGGLFLGVRYRFPVSYLSDVTDDIGTRFTSREVEVGFLFFTVEIQIDTNHRPYNPYEEN